METDSIESLFKVLPYWNYRISKPFKHLLADGVSLEMYYCLQIMQSFDTPPTMSELGQRIQMSKQQLTKIVSRLADRNFVKRIYDPADRRIINLQVTSEALNYIDAFRRQNAEYFCGMIESMEAADRADFKQALDTLSRILSKLPQN